TADENAGRTATCPDCRTKLIVPAGEAVPAAPPQVLPPPVPDEEPAAAPDPYGVQSEEVTPVPRRPADAPYRRPRRDDPDARADITTEVDRQSQEAILGSLRRRFPGDALCAEEETPTLAAAARSGPRVWVVDPIDGTRGFAQKNGEFSVMIALLEEGRVA